jgi:myo-inositol-1(or 4)-monophosphatase
MSAMDIMELLKEICYSVREEVTKLSKKEANEAYGIGAGGDIARKIDLVAESKAIEVIKRYGMQCSLLSEEAGLVNLADDANKYEDGIFVLDAIDGTTNALRGLPIYSCSIAYAESDTLSSVKYAAVINIPSGDIYYAIKGNGAYMNNSRLDHGLTSNTGKGYVIGVNVSGIDEGKLDRLRHILSKANHVRQLGSNALELCFIASGLLDAYIDIRGKIRVTDIAAAYLILKEAGGVIVDDKANELDAKLDIGKRLSYIAAVNKDVLRDILAYL